MKRIAIALIGCTLLAACINRPDTVELSHWQFDYGGTLYKADVQSFIHTDLIANGLIDDPYYGTNEDSVQWVSHCKWTYSTHLQRHRLPKGDSLWVVFEGLAGRADIVLYDDIENPSQTAIYSADNMFVGYRFPLPSFCNDIMVQFYPLYDSVLEAEYGIPLPERRAFTRIAPYQQGWDWGPKLTTCGIWKKVYVTNHPTSINSIDSIKSIGIELRQEKDAIGQSFAFYKDGEPIFIKGANWIPAHSFPALDKAQKERYRQLLTAAKEAGMNMLRVWGGGIYEHDYFYYLCDSLGIMVWQDFMFAGTPYPDSPEMLASIREEARQQVARIGRHPCVVLWCGNNEIKNGWEDWGWQSQYKWSQEQRNRIEKALDTIFGYNQYSNYGANSILARAVAECDPLHRPYISTSPLYGWGHPECTTHGDSHYWGVWWGDEPFEAYRAKTGRFMSEYGFQSYPDYSTLQRIAPADELHMGSPTLDSHQKHSRGVAIIDSAMRLYYGLDSRTVSLADYCYLSQLLQAWGVGYGILCHLQGRDGGRCAGTLFWQLNDCWPVASWSAIDYYGNRKALYYRACDLFADKADLDVWASYYRTRPVDLELQPSQCHVKQYIDRRGRLVAEVSSGQAPLRDVMLQTEPHVDGYFDCNYFDLDTGAVKVAVFTPYNPDETLQGVTVTARSLNDIYQSYGKPLKR
ncbi:MAG: hypothetical protein K5650_06300 [Bacteroidales bacterium]|nr:hypothetical protein [Bacteroidales bacterium]